MILRLTILAAIVLMSGCKKQNTPDNPTGNDTKKSNRSQISVAHFEPKSLDPGVIYDGQGVDISSNIFEGLVTHTADGNLVPGQAQSWETSSDSLTWTFKLRPNLIWSDGTPIRAKDFVWSMRRAVTPEVGNPNVHQFWPIKNAKAISKGDNKDIKALGVRAKGHDHVVIQLERPYPLLPNLMATIYTAPVPQHIIQKNGKQWTRPKSIVSNGPYKLRSHKHEETMVLEKNDRYWGAKDVAISTVKYRFTTQMQTGYQWFKLGEVDWSWGLIPPDMVISMRKARNPGLRTMPYHGYLYLLLNTKRPPLDNSKVRRAIDLAIDRSRYTRQISVGGEKPGAAIVPLGMTQARPPERVRFDPKMARKLLAEAGYGNDNPFPKLEYCFNTNEKNQRVAEFLQRNLKENLGIELSLANMEWKSYLDHISSDAYTMGQLVGGGGYDPLDYLQSLETGGPQNRSHWSNPEYDATLKAAIDSTTVPERDRHITKALAILDREMPSIAISMLVRHALVRPGLNGFESNPENIHPIRWMKWD